MQFAKKSCLDCRLLFCTHLSTLDARRDETQLCLVRRSFFSSSIRSSCTGAIGSKACSIPHVIVHASYIPSYLSSTVRCHFLMIKVLVRELADFFAIEALRRVLKLAWGLGCCSTSLKMPKFWMGTRCIVQYCVCVYDKEVEQL